MQKGREVVFVGAGPVGLWTSIQAKVLDPALRITHYQKHKVYERSHILYVDYTSFFLRENPSSPTMKAKYQDMVDRIKAGGKVEKEFLIVPVGVKIRTNDLETILRDFALEIGINIVYENVASVKELLAKHPGISALVGSDGSHSLVRKEVFEDKKSEDCLQHTVELKADFKGDEDQATNLAKDYYTLKITNFLCVIFAGRANSTGHFPLSLRLFVDEESFTPINATFKHPLHIDNFKDQDFPAKVKDDFVVWLNLLKKRGIEVVQGTDRVSKTKLNSYHSELYAIRHQTHSTYLVGDAAAGFPYLRALNAGLLLGSDLGKIIGNNNPLPQFRYNSLCRLRVLYEDGLAKLKNGALNAGKIMVKINAALPSLMKWSKEEENELREEGILNHGMVQIPRQLDPPNKQ